MLIDLLNELFGKFFSMLGMQNNLCLPFGIYLQKYIQKCLMNTKVSVLFSNKCIVQNIRYNILFPAYISYIYVRWYMFDFFSKSVNLNQLPLYNWACIFHV